MAKGKFIETGRRFVNTWECDENAHLNVQFYFAQFEDAEAQFWSESGLSRASSMHPLTRHVRYHRELAVGDMPIIESALTRAPNGSPAILNLMRADGALAASCLSVLAVTASPRLEQDAGMVPLPEESAPRSIPIEPARGMGRAALEAAGFVPTYRAVVQPAECDGEGHMTARYHIARASDAAGHFWDHIGLNSAWLDEHNFGRVAIEMKLTIRAPMGSGDGLLLLSGLSSHERKTISFSHEFISLRTGESAATLEVTAVTIDKGTRRAVPWPDDRVALMREKVVRL